MYASCQLDVDKFLNVHIMGNMTCANCGKDTERYACFMCEPLTPKEKAVVKVTKVFGEAQGYSALWDALVDAYTIVYAEQGKNQ